NFCWKVRKRADVVAEQRRGSGELAARELHAVTRIAGQTNHDGFEFFNGLFKGLLRCHTVSFLSVSLSNGAPACRVWPLEGQVTLGSPLHPLALTSVALL